MIPALPTLQHSLHASETGVTWLLTGFLLSASVGTAIIGKLGDMYGKQRLLVWTLLMLAAGTLLAALSGSLAMLIVARVIQGVAGGIFPLAFGIARDEFPADRVAGSIGLMSAILGVGGGLGLVVGGLIDEHLSWHWLFWIPLPVMVAGRRLRLALHPGVTGPLARPGQLGRGGADERGMSAVLIAIAQTTRLGLDRADDAGAAGVRPGRLLRMDTGRAAQPQPAHRHDDDAGPRGVDRQPGGLPRRRRAVRVVPAAPAARPAARAAPASATGPRSWSPGCTCCRARSAWACSGSVAGRVERRFGSRRALVAGAAVSAVACGWLAFTSRHPYDMLVSSMLLGIGIGLAFAALGNLIVQAVPPHQTGVASGMNTVLRTLGGALGGQIAATFVAASMRARPARADRVHHDIRHGAVFLAGCAAVALLVPAPAPWARLGGATAGS